MIPALFPVWPFSPLQIAGLEGWYDGADVSTMGLVSTTHLSTWNNKGSIGSEQLTQNTDANRPIYTTNTLNGHSALNCTAGTTSMQTATANGMLRSVTGWTIFCVAKNTANASPPYQLINIAAVNASSTRALGLGITTGPVYQAGGRRNNADAFGADTSATTATNNVWFYSTATGNYSTTTLDLRLNGTSIATNSSWLTAGSTPNDNGATYLGQSPGGSALWVGWWAEFLIYNTALSAANIARVESYLKTKWGL